MGSTGGIDHPSCRLHILHCNSRSQHRYQQFTSLYVKKFIVMLASNMESGAMIIKSPLIAKFVSPLSLLMIFFVHKKCLKWFTKGTSWVSILYLACSFRLVSNRTNFLVRTHTWKTSKKNVTQFLRFSRFVAHWWIQRGQRTFIVAPSIVLCTEAQFSQLSLIFPNSSPGPNSHIRGHQIPGLLD